MKYVKSFILGGIFLLCRALKMEAAANYVCHLSDDFGSHHLNQTVLPNTVSISCGNDYCRLHYNYSRAKICI